MFCHCDLYGYERCVSTDGNKIWVFGGHRTDKSEYHHNWRYCGEVSADTSLPLLKVYCMSCARQNGLIW